MVKECRTHNNALCVQTPYRSSVASAPVLRKKREEAVWAEALCQALRTIVGVSGSTLTLATLAALAQ